MPNVQKLVDGCAPDMGGYFGKTVDTNSLAGLQLTESTYRAGQVLPPHQHAAATMCFVIQGGFDEAWSGSLHEFSQGMLLYRPSGQVHSDRFSAPNTVTLSIDLSEELAAAGPDKATSMKSPAARNLIGRLHREFRRPDDCSVLTAQTLTYLLHDELARLPSEFGARPPRWLLNVQARLRDDFRSTPSLSELAASANVHPTHLTRLFSRFFDCSIGEYLRNLRVEHCRRLLANSDRPIGEISAEAGFCDQAYFTRTFHKALGCPPAEYRRRIRDADP